MKKVKTLLIISAVFVGASVYAKAEEVTCYNGSKGATSVEVGKIFGLGDLCGNWEKGSMEYACCDCIVRKAHCAFRDQDVKAGCDTTEMFNRMLGMPGVTFERIKQTLKDIHSSLGESIKWDKEHQAADFIDRALQVTKDEVKTLRAMRKASKKKEAAKKKMQTLQP